jgi:hypothetical protein
MPKFRYLALASASIMVLAMPAGLAYAASAHPAAKSKPVLTVGKKGGPAVKKGAVLKASLAKKTTVTLTLGSFSATCKSSTIKARVTANPSRPGKATLSVTGQSIGKCSLKVTGVTLKGITALNLPYHATVSNAKGDPVTITASKKSKPLGFKATIALGSTPLTCVYTAKKVSGHASNTGNKVSFTKQSFTLNKAKSSSDCSIPGTTATFSATYRPIVDTTAKHSPKVFIS